MVGLDRDYERTEETAYTRDLAAVYGRNFYVGQSPVEVEGGVWVYDHDDAGFEVWRYWSRRQGGL